MNLSPHFTLEELTSSDLGSRHGIDNTPSQFEIENLTKLANKLEEVRKVLEHPIYITSGYRCSLLNKLVGSKPTSSHVNGLAADIKCPAFGTPEMICRKLAESGIVFDQLILEFPTPEGGGWVHIGIGSKWRRQVLTINNHGTFSGIHI